MSEEQNPQTSQEECSTIDFPEFEDEERWLFKDDGTNNEQEGESLGRTESFLCLQDILQENKTNSTDDDYACQATGFPCGFGGCPTSSCRPDNAMNPTD
ncbi:testis-specific protein TSX [Cricetulus griseus]|uniref:Testis-specific protein TSX n=1 Tax=Cricetulus griseus TaxID=10029 RepID=A0A061HXY1_CRIGR|nr:testis-specific protein TSX [Cricetulus griseus]